MPGAGAGYDVLTLASEGRPTTGLEVAPTAVERFEALRATHGVSPEHARMVLTDFFTWEAPTRFTLIWDYTFLCAIEPGMRAAWCERMDALLAPGGELITLLFPVTPIHDDPGRPPYPIPPEDVQPLLEARFRATHLAPVSESHPSRQGNEWLGRWVRACP